MISGIIIFEVNKNRIEKVLEIVWLWHPLTTEMVLGNREIRLVYLFDSHPSIYLVFRLISGSVACCVFQPKHQHINGVWEEKKIETKNHQNTEMIIYFRQTDCRSSSQYDDDQITLALWKSVVIKFSFRFTWSRWDGLDFKLGKKLIWDMWFLSEQNSIIFHKF